MEKLRGEYDFEIEWKAYELIPEGSSRPLPTPEQLKRGFESFKCTAEKEGLEVNFNPNFKSSRLALEGAKYAQQKNCFEAYNMKVLEAQFIKSKNIADPKVLIEIALEAGLDKTEFKLVLEERRMKDAVDADLAEAKKLQVMAVPTYFIGKTKIVGTQSEAVLRKAFNELENKK